MTFLTLALLAAALLGSTCWASNVWPGDLTWPRSAAARLIWWGAPFGIIVWINGAPWLNALLLGLAAWSGAWIPHVDLPDPHDHWPSVVKGMVVVIARAAAVLAPPGAVFWICGAYWPAMALACSAVLPCMYAGVMLPHRGLGFRDERQVAGVLFGIATGFFLAVAVWTPDQAPDLLP